MNLIFFFYAWIGSYSIYGRLFDHVSSTNTPLESYYITIFETLYENITGKSSSNKAESKCYIKTYVKIGKDSKEFFFKELCDVYGNKYMSLRRVYWGVNGLTDLKNKQHLRASRGCNTCNSSLLMMVD